MKKLVCTVGDERNNTPIFDLTPLVDLPEWSYGVRLLEDSSYSDSWRRLLDRIRGRL